MSINLKLRIRRGMERQINVISTGDVLDTSKHRYERVGTICIQHCARGRVVISTRDIALAMSAVRKEPASWGYTPYSSRQSISGHGKTRLLASSRAGDKWVIELGGTGRFIEIEPGEELKVRHTTACVEAERAAA